MTAITVGEHGEMALPGQVRDRYGLCPNRQVRIVETRGGILLVPLTDAPMSEELRRELDEWQALGSQTLTAFTYQDEEP